MSIACLDKLVDRRSQRPGTLPVSPRYLDAGATPSAYLQTAGVLPSVPENIVLQEHVSWHLTRTP